MKTESKDGTKMDMAGKDHIVRAMAADNQLRVFVADTKNLVEQARRFHESSPVATAALGRLLTAGAMMGSMMKGEKDLLTLQIQGDGPIGGVTVTANAAAQVKGYVNNPAVMLPPSPKGKLDVGRAVGRGMLRVIKDIGMKEPYNGTTELVSGEIAEDLTYYFAASEQIPSAVALGVLMEKNNTVQCAGGFIIQVMPFVEDEVVSKLEERIGKISPVTSYLSKGMTAEDILQEILGDFSPKITDCIEAGYHCGCSKERVSRAIASIAKGDIQAMIDEGESIQVDCHFCDKSYTFTVEDLRNML